MALDWHSSGSGEDSVTLQDAQHLAVDAGFTYEGDDGSLPLARRADLQAMFEHFNVNSLSAFRRIFATHKLQPGAPIVGKGRGSRGKASCQPAGGGHNRSRWQVQQQGETVYIGELVDGRWQGIGILLSKGKRSWQLHVGHFSEGRRNGLGVATSCSGERLEGHFLDDVPWGPVVYTFALPPGQEAGGAGLAGAKARLRYIGMMNGRPLGKGCTIWSDGRQEKGQFDGLDCGLALEDDDVSTVLAVAADNASKAQAAADAVQEEALRQEPHIVQQVQQVQQMFDRLCHPSVIS